MPTDSTRRDVRHLLTDWPELVEVLPRAEYEDEHLPGAINFPLEEPNRPAYERLTLIHGSAVRTLR